MRSLVLVVALGAAASCQSPPAPASVDAARAVRVPSPDAAATPPPDAPRPSPDAPPPAAPASTSPATAGHDQWCQKAQFVNGKVKQRPCAPGLRCCRPCGIGGCDWVCHTPRECGMDQRRP